MRLAHTAHVPQWLFGAARVSRFLPEDRRGRWRLRHFTITREDYEQKMMRLHFHEHPNEMKARAVPPGSYVSLQREMTMREAHEIIEDHTGISLAEAARQADMTPDQFLARVIPPDRAWTPVMSDTPAEILEHAPALRNAHGRVLITGLGLGCLPHALLEKPGVTRIDIIEIDPDVIRLTGSALVQRANAKGARLHIHHASATEPPFASGTRFDYVWHDIWSHVSDRNLDTETAEHGISYSGLFELYGRRYDVGATAAWAYDLAKHMRREERRERAANDAFVEHVRSLPFEEQVQATVDHIIRDRVRVGPNADPFPEGEPLPEHVRRFMDPDGRLEQHVRTVMAEPDFWEGYGQHRGEKRHPDPLGNPNEHLEV